LFSAHALGLRVVACHPSRTSGRRSAERRLTLEMDIRADKAIAIASRSFHARGYDAAGSINPSSLSRCSAACRQGSALARTRCLARSSCDRNTCGPHHLDQAGATSAKTAIPLARSQGPNPQPGVPIRGWRPSPRLRTGRLAAAGSKCRTPPSPERADGTDKCRTQSRP
jgi:hypothetical protein